MISSLLHRLNLVEHTLNGNAQLLSELQLLEFEAEPCQRDAHAGRDLDTLSGFLRRLEPLLERSTDRLHLLAGAVIHQRAELGDIKALSAYALPSGTQPVDTRLGGPLAVDDFLPSDKALSAAARNFVQRGRMISRRDIPTDDLSPSSECTGVDARCCHLGNHQRSMNRTPAADGGGESQHGCAGGVRVTSAAAGGFDCATREGGCGAGGPGVDGTDIVAEMLEAELQKQETVIHRMMRCNETLANKEQEYERKNDWYEHKMRLLKQDKRKRGETIGKLLRCIDDMRETSGGGLRVADDYTVSPDDRVDQDIGRGARLDGRGGGGAGWVDDTFRDVFQELQDEHRVRLRENASLETCTPNDLDLGFDDDKGRQGFGSDEYTSRFGLGSNEDKSRFGLGSDEDKSRFGLGSDEDRSRFVLGSDEDKSRFDLGSDEIGSRLGLDRQQKRPSDFVVRHFPSLLTRSTGREFLSPLGKDADSRNGKDLSSGQFSFTQ